MKKNQKNNDDNNKHIKEIFTGLSLIAHLGVTMVVCILAMFFLGLYLDKKFNLGGIAIIVFTILGVISGAVGCYKMLKNNEDSE